MSGESKRQWSPWKQGFEPQQIHQDDKVRWGGIEKGKKNKGRGQGSNPDSHPQTPASHLSICPPITPSVFSEPTLPTKQESIIHQRGREKKKNPGQASRHDCCLNPAAYSPTLMIHLLTRRNQGIFCFVWTHFPREENVRHANANELQQPTSLSMLFWPKEGNDK